jgi:hypothetical protein
MAQTSQLKDKELELKTKQLELMDKELELMDELKTKQLELMESRWVRIPEIVAGATQAETWMLCFDSMWLRGVLSDLLRLTETLNMRGALGTWSEVEDFLNTCCELMALTRLTEEIIGLVKPAFGLYPWTPWTANDWEGLFK